MDLTLTPEQDLVRTTARELCDREIAPHAREWDRTEEMDGDVVAKLGEMAVVKAAPPATQVS